MRYSRAKEVRVWWPLPLAALLWLIIIWGFGFFLTSPEVKTESQAPVQASFIELPEEKKEQKSAATPQKAPRVPPRPKSQPRLGDQKAKPVPREKGTAKKEAKVERTPAPKPEPPKDLTDYMKEAKERRTAGGIFEDEPTEPKNVERESTEEELRMANVKRNLREPGVGGIFQITRMGVRSAQFLFRAWKSDASNPRREVIEVTAGPDGDIQLALVRKMIELIRQYHKEEFQWESYRLDRVVTMSARMEDSKALEDFLIREFFDAKHGFR